MIFIEDTVVEEDTQIVEKQEDNNNNFYEGLPVDLVGASQDIPNEKIIDNNHESEKIKTENIVENSIDPNESGDYQSVPEEGLHVDIADIYQDVPNE